MDVDEKWGNETRCLLGTGMVRWQLMKTQRQNKGKRWGEDGFTELISTMQGLRGFIYIVLGIL